MGLGWISSHGSGKGRDTITSGIEGAWTPTPTQWNNSFFENLFGFEWELTESPAGANQWVAKDAGADLVPDPETGELTRKPMMTTADMALRMDPIYEPISRRFMENPEEFADAFARAWYKLCTATWGRSTRYLGPWVAEQQLWQDPVPAVDHELVDDADVAALKETILDSGLSVAQLVRTAWASAASFRATDKRGGANGARIRLAPQKDWAVNEPAELATVLRTLERVQSDFNGGAVRRQEDLAGRPDRPGRLRRRGEGREGRGSRHHGAVHAGAYRCLAGADRRRGVRRAGARADGFRNYIDPDEKLPRSTSSSTGRTCSG